MGQACKNLNVDACTLLDIRGRTKYESFQDSFLDHLGSNNHPTASNKQVEI
jgi:hypothetical protein